jgi:hypothetical protein
MVTLLDLLAGVAFLLTDVLALLSVLGSALVFLGTAVAAAFGRRFRAPEQILTWSIGGLLFGTVGLLLLTLSLEYSPKPSPWLGYSRATIGWLLLLSFLLVVASKLLATTITPARNERDKGSMAKRNSLYRKGSERS